MYVIMYEGDVLFWGNENSVDDFIHEYPWFSDVVDVLTWDEYLSL